MPERAPGQAEHCRQTQRSDAMDSEKAVDQLAAPSRASPRRGRLPAGRTKPPRRMDQEPGAGAVVAEQLPGEASEWYAALHRPLTEWEAEWESGGPSVCRDQGRTPDDRGAWPR